MRTFFWVPAGTINRDRPERMVKTVAGTGDFHEVKSGGKGVISARHLTCFCEPCLTGEGDCVNEGIVVSFSETTLILAICRTAAAKAKQAAPALSTPATVRSTPATTQGLIDPISRLHRATYRVSWAYLYCNGIPDRSRPCRHHFDVPGVIGCNVVIAVRDQLSAHGNEFLTNLGKAAEHLSWAHSLAVYSGVKHDATDDSGARIGVAGTKPQFIPACSIRVIQGSTRPSLALGRLHRCQKYHSSDRRDAYSKRCPWAATCGRNGHVPQKIYPESFRLNSSIPITSSEGQWLAMAFWTRRGMVQHQGDTV